MLGDGMMPTGENLAECQSRGIDLYSPMKGERDPANPALRTDPTIPVAAALIEKLPTIRVTRAGRTPVERRRYKAAAGDCQACPLRALCVHGRSRSRTLSREPHEDLRDAHARKMATQKAQDLYAQRRRPGERPFAVIKQAFGARGFLLRGLLRVRQEWQWLAASFNLDRLMSFLRNRAGPPPPPPRVAVPLP